MNTTDPSEEAESHYLEASSTYESEEYETALEKSNLAIACDPDYAEAYNLRAAIQEELGLQAAAMADYREAMRLDPGFQEARQNLLELEVEYFGFMRPGWVFFVLWVLIYTMCLGVILPIVNGLFSDNFMEWVEQGKLFVVYLTFMLIRIIVVGVLAAALQLGLLRGRVNPGRWLLASAAGILVADASSILFAYLSGGSAWGKGLDMFLPGAIIGLIQWVVLSERIQKAGWWALVTSAAWFLASVAALLTIGFGLVYGAVTGVGLMWLCRQPVDELFLAEEVMEE